MKSLLFTLLFLRLAVVSAQAEYSQGFIITAKNDTVNGEIKLNRKNELEVYSKIMFREKIPGPVKTFTPAKIHGYSLDGIDYSSIRMENQWVFMQVVCKGKISFFEYKPPVSMGNEKMQSQYFIMKGGFDELDQFFVDGKAKKHIREYIADDKSLVKEIGQETIDYSGLVQTINRYNERNK